MADGQPDRDLSRDSLLAGIADDYLARLKAGECPRVEDYAQRQPELAAEIGRMRRWKR
jgi:hypothetical protein